MYAPPTRPQQKSGATDIKFMPGITRHKGTATGAFIVSTTGIYTGPRARALVIAVVADDVQMQRFLAVADDLSVVMGQVSMGKNCVAGQLLIPLNARHPLNNLQRKQLENNNGITIIQPVWATPVRKGEILNLTAEAEHALRFHNQKQVIQYENSPAPHARRRTASRYTY
jgi:hypothetical protein